MTNGNDRRDETLGPALARLVSTLDQVPLGALAPAERARLADALSEARAALARHQSAQEPFPQED